MYEYKLFPEVHLDVDTKINVGNEIDQNCNAYTLEYANNVISLFKIGISFILQ